MGGQQGVSYVCAIRSLLPSRSLTHTRTLTRKFAASLLRNVCVGAVGRGVVVRRGRRWRGGGVERFWVVARILLINNANCCCLLKFRTCFALAQPTVRCAARVLCRNFFQAFLLSLCCCCCCLAPRCRLCLPLSVFLLIFFAASICCCLCCCCCCRCCA